MLNYDEMLIYVHDYLLEHDAIRAPKANQPFRSRYDHIRRVFEWCKVLSADYPGINEEILYTSAIFHDVGYAFGKIEHAKNSAVIFTHYAEEHGFDEEFTKTVAHHITVHSDKTYLNEASAPELIVLLEADLMDEEGAMGIAFDLLALGYDGVTSYEEAIENMGCHSTHILNQDFMISPKAREIWNEKKRLVYEFVHEFRYDLFLGEEHGNN